MPNVNAMLIFLAMIVACYADDVASKHAAKDGKISIATPTQTVVNVTKESAPVKKSDILSTKSDSMSMDLTPPQLPEKHIARNVNERKNQDGGPEDLKEDETIGFGFYAGIGAPVSYRSYYPSYYPYYRSPYYYRPYWGYPYYGSYYGVRSYKFPILG